MLSRRWLRASIRLKYKNQFTILKSLFQPNINFLPKVFRGRFDPIYGYQSVNKSLQKTVDSGNFEQSEPSCLTFQTISKTTNSLSIHITDNQIPHFQDRSKATHLRHTTVLRAANQPPKNNLHPLTSWLLSGGRREPVSLLIYQPLFM